MFTKPESQKPNDTSPSHTRELLVQMINGYWISQMIRAAVSLGIADLVADGPKSSAELAKTTGTHAAGALPVAARPRQLGGVRRRRSGLFWPDAAGGTAADGRPQFAARLGAFRH